MTRNRLVSLAAIAFVAGVGLDMMIGYSPVPGYGAGLGLFGCIVIVVGSKWIGKAGIQQPENYYPEDLPADLHASADADGHPGSRSGEAGRG